MEKIINRIVEYRKIRGISQQEIASKLGMTQVNYSRFETGKTTLTVERLVKIARILEIDLITLLFPEFDNVKYFQTIQEENARLKRNNDTLLYQIDELHMILGVIFKDFPKTRELFENKKLIEKLIGVEIKK